MDHSPLPAVIYARVSMDEQAKNYSLPTQVAAGRQYAAANGMMVVGEYLEDHTGAELNRPALDEMIQALKSGAVRTVIVYSIDRLARKLLYALMIEEDLRRLGVEVRYVLADYDNSPDGTLMKQISGSIAEYERARIAERMRRGKHGRLSAGYPLPTPTIPYGYRYVTTAAHTGHFEVEPGEAAIVREIYEWYTAGGLGVGVIATRLTEMGISRPSRTSGGWAKGTVLNILKNPIYKGVYIWNRHKAPQDEQTLVDVPAIVDPETWERVQQMVIQNRQLSKRKTRKVYLMRGRMICGVCGRTLRCGTQHENYSYYMCPDSGPACKRFLIHREVDAMIWRQVAALLSDPDEITRRRAELAEGEAEERRKREAAIKTAQARLVEIERRQLSLIELYETGRIKSDLLEKRNDALQAQHDRGRRDLERMRAEHAQAAMAGDALERVGEYAQGLKRRLCDLSMAEKRRVIDDLNLHATLHRGERADKDRIVLSFR